MWAVCTLLVLFSSESAGQLWVGLGPRAGMVLQVGRVQGVLGLVSTCWWAGPDPVGSLDWVPRLLVPDCQ